MATTAARGRLSPEMSPAIAKPPCLLENLPNELLHMILCEVLVVNEVITVASRMDRDYSRVDSLMSAAQYQSDHLPVTATSKSLRAIALPIVLGANTFYLGNLIWYSDSSYKAAGRWLDCIWPNISLLRNVSLEYGDRPARDFCGAPYGHHFGFMRKLLEFRDMFVGADVRLTVELEWNGYMNKRSPPIKPCKIYLRADETDVDDLQDAIEAALTSDVKMTWCEPLEEVRDRVRGQLEFL